MSETGVNHLVQDGNSDSLSAWCGESEHNDRTCCIVLRVSMTTCRQCLNAVVEYAELAAERLFEIDNRTPPAPES